MGKRMRKNLRHTAAKAVERKALAVDAPAAPAPPGTPRHVELFSRGDKTIGTPP